ncbi:MAG: hypothetical protein GXO65_06670 [Euryarchaeota archaeon]|nr:hypothetical protein [Euryarchaeota archaeon]
MWKIRSLQDLGGGERTALAGWLVGVISTLGYAVFYPRVQGGASGVFLKAVFFFVTFMDYLAQRIRPDFSLTFALLYSFKFAPLGFVFMLAYLGFLGAALGLLVRSVYAELRKRVGPTAQS